MRGLPLIVTSLTGAERASKQVYANADINYSMSFFQSRLTEEVGNIIPDIVHVSLLSSAVGASTTTLVYWT